MREFGVGYAPGDVTELLRNLREEGFSDGELVRAGVATPPAASICTCSFTPG